VCHPRRTSPCFPLARAAASVTANPAHDAPAALEQQLIAAMGSPGGVLSLALDVPGPGGKGTLLLSAATLSYVVLCRAIAAG
jgi:hypothetical protein